MKLYQWITALSACYFLLANIPLAELCPQNCRCLGSKWIKVQCGGLGLREIPHGIPQNTFYLDLSYNKLQNVPSQTFENLTKLMTLNIESNLLKAEDLNNILIGSEQLQSLYASGNPFGPVLPDTLFNQHENLRLLDLTECKLEAIIPKTFGALRKLTLLNIRRNRITRLEHGVFEGLTHTLTSMRLNGNRIKHIDDGLFLNLTGLTTLFLNENELKEVPDLTGLPFSMSYLNLADNYIEDISNLSRFGFRRFFQLILSSNRITKVPPDIFRSINVMSTLDLSNNRIQSVPDGAFSICTSLTDLHLYHNIISRITPKTFKGLTGLKNLLLFNNNLTAIPSFAFSDCSNLAILLLHQNSINFIGKNAFHGIKGSIQTVAMFSNPLASLPSKIFDDLNSGTKMVVSCKNLFHMPAPINTSATVVCTSAELFYLTIKNQEYLSRKSAKGLRTSGFSAKPCKNVPHCMNYTLCQPGYRGGDLQIGQDCIPCPPGGFYHDEQGKLECKRCGPGNYVSVERHPGTSPVDCWACPKGTATDETAGHRACRCLAEFHRTDRFGACSPCQVKGIICQNDTATLAPNYYWSWTNKTQEYEYQQFVKNIAIEGSTYDATYSKFDGSLPIAHRCFREQAACLGGLESKCGEGYTGLLCSECKSSHFLRMNTCVKCPTKTKAILRVAGVIIAFILVLIAVVWGDSKRAGRNRTWADVILSRFKIIVSFYQVITGVFSALARVRWPASVLEMTRWLKYVEANILELAPLSCVDSRLRFDPLQQFALAVSLNGLVVVAFLIYLFIRRKCIYYKKNVSSMEKREALSAARRSCYRNIFLFLFTTYPSTCVKIVEILPPACFTLCFSENETQCSSFLRSDLSIQCFTPRHNKYWYPAMVFLLYPLGFPLLVLALLWMYYHKPSKSQIQLDGDQNEESTPSLPIHNSDTGGRSNENEDETGSAISPSSLSAAVATNDLAEDDLSDDELHDGIPKIHHTALRSFPVLSHGQRTRNSDITFSLSLFYENYKPRYWFWEVTEMYRKLILMTGLALIGSQSRCQIGIGVLLAGGFSILHAAYRPIADKFENALQTIALLVVFFDLTLGVMLKIADTDIPVDVNTENDSTGVSILFVFVNCLVIAIALVMAMKTILPHIIKCWRNDEGRSCCCGCITMRCVCILWRWIRRYVRKRAETANYERLN